jgi:hypothetical protein
MEIESSQPKFSVMVHEIQIKCKILEGSVTPESYKENQMKNWNRKLFTLKGLDDQLLIASTDKFVMFCMQGVGANCNEAIENARARAILVKEFIEEKYNCKLTMPEYSALPPHFTHQ